MTRRLRMIFSMILAVMLCVVFSMPSLAFEADEPAPEAEPEEVMVTEPAPEPTVTISAPVEIAVIPDEDWGSVGPEAIANVFTPAVTEEAESGGDTEPEETPGPAETAAAEPQEAPETPEPAGNEPLTDAEEMSAEDQPAEEMPVAEQPAEETPETEPPAADTPEEDTEGEETDETVTENQPAAEEPVQEFPEEVIPDGEETEEVSEEPEEGPEEPEEGPEEPEEAPEELEAATEPETARVTVTVEISMIDDTIMRLLAVVNDPEGRDFLYQWQVSEDSGMTYTDIPEANTDELKVELTDENITDMWRVKVQAV